MADINGGVILTTYKNWDDPSIGWLVGWLVCSSKSEKLFFGFKGLCLCLSPKIMASSGKNRDVSKNSLLTFQNNSRHRSTCYVMMGERVYLN